MNRQEEIRSFTGWRGLAVLFVLLYHWFPQTIPGGYLGVVLFLILSGYLVTDQLLHAFQTGKSSVLAFYQKRIARLYPPLMFLLLVLTLWASFVDVSFLQNFREGWLSTFFGVNNWWMISRKISYFDLHAQPSVFTHLWTLSVEIQFYLVWPWILRLCKKIADRSTSAQFFARLVAWVSAFLSLLSAAWMAFSYYFTQDTARIYYGTDTRLFAFTLGGFLAALLPRARLLTCYQSLTRLLRILFTILAFSSLLLALFALPGNQAATYLGLMFLFALIFLLNLILSTSPQSPAGHALDNPFLRYLGTRSYSLYLWQFTLNVLIKKLFQNTLVPYWAIWLLQLGLLLVLAEISYQFFEKQASSALRAMLSWLRHPIQKVSTSALLYFCFSLLCFLPFSYAFNHASSGESEEIVEAKLRLAQNEARFKNQQNLFANLKPTQSIPRSSSTLPSLSQVSSRPSAPSTIPISSSHVLTPTQSNKIKEEDPKKTLPDESHSKSSEESPGNSSSVPKLSSSDFAFAKNLPLLAIGDSVLEMCANDLQNYFPRIQVDAAVSRQFAAGLPILKSYQQKNQLPSVVLYALGTNGVIAPNMLDELATSFPKTTFFLMTVVCPDPWENSVNQMLRSAVSKHNNLHLIDWYGYAKTKQAWFYQDGTHPNLTGSPYYAQFVAKSLIQILH